MISNPNSAGYKNALAADPTLTRGREAFECHYSSKALELKSKNNVKDPDTSITMSYRIIEKETAE